MKIGIIGNMNNMYFSLARFLVEEGYDCDLLVCDYEPSHFDPTADSFKKQVNFTIKKLSWGDPAHFFKNKEIIKHDLSKYSFLIGSGTAPGFVNKIGRVLDLFIPYGDDLYALPFPRLVHPLRQIPYLVLAWHQRKGIQKTPYILFDKTNPEFENVFRKLNYQGKRIVSPLPLIYYKEYEIEANETSNPYFQRLQTLRSENDLLILQHIRQFWKTHADKWTQKGNDKLIRGYAQFVAENHGIKTKLLLLEYGIDVKHTKSLINELKIREHVEWFPKTPRKHLMLFIKTCDVVVGELHHSWNSYCSAFEALAMGKPLIHRRDDKDFINDYPELYPMINASSADTVYKALEEVAKNKMKMDQIGAAGKQWYLEYAVQKPLEVIKSIIAEKQKKVHA